MSLRILGYIMDVFTNDGIIKIYITDVGLHCIFFFFLFLLFLPFKILASPCPLRSPRAGWLRRPLTPRPWVLLHPYTFDRCTQMQCNQRSPTWVNYTKLSTFFIDCINKSYMYLQTFGLLAFYFMYIFQITQRQYKTAINHYLKIETVANFV